MFTILKSPFTCLIKQREDNDKNAVAEKYSAIKYLYDFAGRRRQC